MPRKARDERLDTRTARLKLPARREPYWRTIQEGRAVGYRRIGGKAGTWIARHYDPAAGRSYQSLGCADDMLDADGADTLTFAQAQDRAAAWFRELGKTQGRVVMPMTLREAVEHYLADYRARGGKAEALTRMTFEAHVLPVLGDRLLPELTPAMIRGWHRALAAAPARLRGKAGRYRERASDPHNADLARARRATANRILTALKAALNLAYREGRVPHDDAWRRVQPFQKVEAPRVRYLSDDEAVRLANACPPDLRALVTAALLTGARYGELVALQAGDVDPAAGVLTIRASKAGGARHVVLTAEAARFFAEVCGGKATRELILRRADGEAWGRSHQFRPLREACVAARITPAISFHVLRHTHASRLAMRGVPMGVIAAQLGHASVTITGRHYAHLSPGYIAATIREAFGDTGLVPEAAKAVPIHVARG